MKKKNNDIHKEEKGTKRLIVIMAGVVVVLLAGIIVKWAVTGDPNPFSFVMSKNTPLPTDPINGTEEVTVGETETDTAIRETEEQSEEETTMEEPTLAPITYDDSAVEAIITKMDTHSFISIEKRVELSSWDADLPDPDYSNKELIRVDNYAYSSKMKAIREVHSDTVNGTTEVYYHDKDYSLIKTEDTIDAPFTATDTESAVDYQSFESISDLFIALVGESVFRVNGSSFVSESEESGVNFYYGYADYDEEDFKTDEEAGVFMCFYGEELPTQVVITLWKAEDGVMYQMIVTYDINVYSEDEMKLPDIV